MNEEKVMITIAWAVVLAFVGLCVWLVIARPQFDSGEIPDTRSTTEKQCANAGGVYTTGFFSEGCVFIPKEPS